MEIKEQGIYVLMKIWTIKNLNLNEKLILSDIYNKSLLKDYKGYNKKAFTLSQELGIKENTVLNILKSLQKKEYIFCTPLRKRTEGRFSTILSQRDINISNINKAEKYSIPENNIFYRNSKEGCYFSYDDIRIINSWSTNGKYAVVRLKLLIVFIIIKKIAFIHKTGTEENIELYARFTLQDISDFLGISRYTIGKYINGYKNEKNGITGLTEKQSFNKTPLRILYQLGDKEMYQELVEEIIDFNIMTNYRNMKKVIKIDHGYGEEEEVSIDNTNTLYYINYYGLLDIGISFTIDKKIEKYSSFSPRIE